MVKKVSRRQGQKQNLISTQGRKRKNTKIQRNKKNSKNSKELKTKIAQESDNIFDVEEVIGCKTQNGKTFYLIKWFGYPRSESTWEPLENLANVHELIQRFERKREEGKESAESKNTEDTNEIVEEAEEEEEEKKLGEIVNGNDIGNLVRRRGIKKREKICNKNCNKISNIKDELMNTKEVEENKDNNNNTNKNTSNNKEFNKEKFSAKISRRSLTKKYGKLLRVMQVQKGKNGFLEAVIETLYNGSNKMIVMGCKELRKVNPEILLDFYESRISFYNKE